MIPFIMAGILVASTFLIAPYRSDGFFVLGSFSIAMVIAGLMIHASAYYGQICKIESIEESKELGKIHKEKAEALTEEFKLLLGEKYPDMEKAIFRDLIPNNVSVFAVKFPEIKSSETIMELVSRINKLQSNVYDERINIEKYKKGIRIAKRNIWVISHLIPTK